MKTLKSERVKLKAKRTFIKKGTCSRTFFYILDREFGHPREDEEKAIDPLAGGILQQGYQCGMLWGASMAVGAEAYRRKGTRTVLLQSPSGLRNSLWIPLYTEPKASNVKRSPNVISQINEAW